MPNLTISISEELKKEMDEFRIMNWSEVAREAFSRRIEQLAVLRKFENDFKTSKLSDKDVEELSKLVKAGLYKKK